MRVLVTGAAGHLGRALMHLLGKRGYQAVGTDSVAGPDVSLLGDLRDAQWVTRHVQNFDAILHLATLHKPPVATHSRQEFVDVNVNGTLNLLGAPIQWMNKASKRCG